jgi:hypothetical protein
MSSKFLRPILLRTTDWIALTSMLSDSVSGWLICLRSSRKEVALLGCSEESLLLLLGMASSGWMHL